MSQKYLPDPTAVERANYVRVLQGYVPTLWESPPGES